MKKLKAGFLFLLIVIILIGVSACGQMDGSELDATETPTPTPEIGQGIGNTNNPADDHEDESEPSPDPTLPPAFGDNCLIGTWRVDHESFYAYMTQAMNVSDAAQFVFGEIEGDLEMVISPDMMAFRTAEPLRIPLSMSASGVNLLSLDMVIEGSGDAYWLTYENLYIIYGPNYNFAGDGLADVISTDLVGKAEVRVTMTPDLLVSMASFTNVDITPVLAVYPEIENYAVATYTCEGDVFTYQFGEYEAVWLRQ